MEEPKEDLKNKQDSNSNEDLKSKDIFESKDNLDMNRNLESKDVPKKKKLYVHLFKFLSDAFSILLIVFIVIVVYSAINGRGANGIAIGSFRMFNILSDSMSPVINKGDVVLTQAADKEQLQVRDIITFMPSEDAKVMLTHRIVAQGEEDFFITRGDANNTDDNPVHFENIVGKVIMTIPMLGMFISFASTSDGIVLLVVMFALLVILIEIVKRILKT